MIFFVLWKYLCNFAVDVWVLGDRCLVLAVTIERKKSPFKGYLEGLQIRSKSVPNPLQIRFKSLPYIGTVIYIMIIDL